VAEGTPADLRREHAAGGTLDQVFVSLAKRS